MVSNSQAEANDYGLESISHQPEKKDIN